MKTSSHRNKLVATVATLSSVFAVIYFLQPTSIGPGDAQALRPYFSQENSFFARGNFINLDEESFEKTDLADLTSPGQVWTVAGTNSVALNWSRHPLAASYKVEYSEGKTQSSQTAEVETPFFTVRNARAGQSYAFRVKTVGENGSESEFSPKMAVTPSSFQKKSTTKKSDFEVAGWLPPGWEDPDVQSSFNRGVGTLTILNSFWYNFSLSGKLEPKGQARNPEIVARAHQSDMQVIPTITNNYDPNRVSVLLADKDMQDEFLKDVLEELKTYDYDGIDLDFENVRTADRDQFTDFLIKVSRAVHAEDKIVELTAQAKKSDGDNWDGPGALDLAKLEPHLDRFKPMLYDFSRSDTEPGPIGPLPWMKEVLDYWKTKIPDEKILAGIPFYGYDWSLATDDDVGIVWDGVERIKEKFDVEELYDSIAGEPFLRYSEPSGPHVVYYQDAASIKRKIQLVKETGVAGVAIWLLGSEDPGNFAAIRNETTTTTQIIEKPLNIGLRVKGKDVAVSLTKFPEIASTKVLFGPEPNQLTETIDGKELSVIQLPPLRDKETRYVVVIAYDSKGNEIKRSGTAMVDASSDAP